VYIVFEGIDFVGKSTQANRLKKVFPDFIWTREPGGTEFGKRIRDMVLYEEFYLNRFSEFLLFLADRSEHYRRVLKPNLEAGKTILSDRSMISGMAYAKTNGGIKDDDILSMNLLSVESLKPDLVIFFEISQEEFILRKKQKRGDNIEIRGVDYAFKVQENIKFWIDKLQLNSVVIDASQDIDTIFKRVERVITSKVVQV